MSDFLHLTIPFKDPVTIFAILLAIALVIPIILKKLKIPGIVGLIISGMLVGPHGAGILLRDSSVELLGTVGLIYLMFLAGLELDIGKLKSHKYHSIVFGALTFLIPLLMGTVVMHYFMNYDVTASVLIALMFSTHTLIAYPIASRLGITGNLSVIITVGGTIITDAAVLLCLGVVTNHAQGNLDFFYWTKLIVSMAALTAIVFVVYPKLSRWFFKNIEEENYSQFVFVLALVFLAGFMSEMAGVEPIIGAFFAGLALNRLIPHSSALMSRLQFTANALFIPFFLISVGMLVNLQVIFQEPHAIIIAVALTFLALLSKYIAAWITQVVFKFSIIERYIIFGLSSSRVAATIAVILIGYNLGIIDSNILNGTILLVLFTCLVSSFVTEVYGRKLAIVEQAKKSEIPQSESRILVPCANPKTMDKLLWLAVAGRNNRDSEPIYPIAVFLDDETFRNNVASNKKEIEKVVHDNFPEEKRIIPTARIDTNPADGITRAAKELMISTVILGWSSNTRPSSFIYGNLADHVLQNANQTVLLSRIYHHMHISERLFVAVPNNAEFEVGFEKWVRIIGDISKNIGVKVKFYGFEKTLAAIGRIAKKQAILNETNYNIMTSTVDFEDALVGVSLEDSVVIVHARPKSISFSSSFDDLIKTVSKEFTNLNAIIIYPEQNPVTHIDDLNKYDILDASLIKENINVVQRIISFFKDKKNKI